MSLSVLYKVRQPELNPGDTTQLLYSGARIPRDAFRSLCLADQVLREAETAASQLREKAAALLESERQQAHAEGFARGHVQAMAAVLGTLETERRLRDLLSHRMADIIEHCLRGLLGELGDSQLMRRRVLHLLRTAGAASPGASIHTGTKESAAGLGTVTLHVCPEQLVEAQKIVAEWSRSGLGNIGGLIVVADERRAFDSLLLETKLSFIDSDLDMTLQQVRNLVRDAANHVMQQPRDAA